MSVTAIKYPALPVSAATAELGKDILVLYPQAQIVPRVAPLEELLYPHSKPRIS